MKVTIADTLDLLKEYEEEWNPSLQASIMKLPNGYLIRDYDVDTDKYTGTCFVPLEHKEKK